MKFFLLVLIVLSAQFLIAQKTDSTDIKLQQYKSYYDSGLITTADYDLLKEKLLQIGKFSPARHPSSNTDVMQYDKNTTFEIRIEPAAYFGLPGTYKTSGHDINNGNYVYTEKIQHLQYGGIDLAFGAAFYKRYHVHFDLGFNGNKDFHTLALGADVNINLLKGKISPFIHLGGGYASTNVIADFEEGQLTGFYTSGGIGIYIQVTRFCALNISPEYRFTYGYHKQKYDSNQPADWRTDQAYLSQIGLKMSVVFY